MNIFSHANSPRKGRKHNRGPQPVTSTQSEADILKIENDALRSRLEHAHLEIEKLVAASMREVHGQELMYQLTHLDNSNGWGVDYEPDVFVRFKNIKDGIKTLLLDHGSYPVGSKPEGEFSSCLVIDTNGKPALFERWEVSMLNYKVFSYRDRSLDELIDMYANGMLRTHLNKIRVLHHA